MDRNFPKMLAAPHLRIDWRTQNATYHCPHYACCSRSSVVAREQVYPHAVTNQIDPERRIGHRFGFVDCESLRSIRSPKSFPRRALTRRSIEAGSALPARWTPEVAKSTTSEMPVEDTLN
jgi:hypothetical protein